MGWMVSGYFAWVTLWVWGVVVLLYGLWRSLARPEPDPIRPPGPIEGWSEAGPG